MNIIVAADENWGIGYEGGLLYSIPEDRKFFKRMTLGKTVVMGRKTLQSLPGGAPLRGRKNIVLSRSGGGTKYSDNAGGGDKKTVAFSGESSGPNACGAVFCASVAELYKLLSPYKMDDVFIIGGQEIYERLINYCAAAYITKIEGAVRADRFFPNINNMGGWQIESESAPKTYGGLVYRFIKYSNCHVLSMVTNTAL